MTAAVASLALVACALIARDLVLRVVDRVTVSHAREDSLRARIEQRGDEALQLFASFGEERAALSARIAELESYAEKMRMREELDAVKRR